MFKKGDKVVYNGTGHDTEPEFYPKAGTTGIFDENCDDGTAWVLWEKGSTDEDGCWCCEVKHLKKRRKWFGLF